MRDFNKWFDMDYEKAYKEALKRAKSFRTPDNKDVAAYIFPVLAESEDEKIRKELIEFVKSRGGFKQEYIAWLEKQGEQKAKYHDICDKCVRQPICQSDCFLQQEEQKLSEWSEEDERMYKAVSIALSLKDAKGYLRSWHTTPEEADNWLKSLKERVQPKQEWSEEDKMQLDAAIHLVSSTGHIETANWLKSLRPQSIWKPSDEQMEYLAKAITTLGDEGDCKTALILNDLRFELKKLREE